MKRNQYGERWPPKILASASPIFYTFTRVIPNLDSVTAQNTFLHLVLKTTLLSGHILRGKMTRLKSLG